MQLVHVCRVSVILGVCGVAGAVRGASGGGEKKKGGGEGLARLGARSRSLLPFLSAPAPASITTHQQAGQGGRGGGGRGGTAGTRHARGREACVCFVCGAFREVERM